MSIDRLSQLEIQYDLLQDQLNRKEVEKILAPFGDQTRIQQQIDLGILPQLKECKHKYLEALASGTALDALTEKQAEVIVGEIVEELTIAKADATQPEIMALMEQVLAKLNEPENVVLRLKLGVKLPFEIFEAGAELEGDAVELWKKHCPTFESWRQKAKKLFPPA
jgi:hypothetical protein